MSETVKKLIVFSLKLINYLMIIILGRLFIFPGIMENFDKTFFSINIFIMQNRKELVVVYFLIVVISLIILLIDFISLLNYFERKKIKKYDYRNRLTE